jgi:hypothetical protein
MNNGFDNQPAVQTIGNPNGLDAASTQIALSRMKLLYDET